MFSHIVRKTILQIHLWRKRNNWSCLGRGIFFLRRNPIIASHKAQNLNSGTAQKLNPFVANDYFAKLRRTIEELWVMNKPECVYNADKKGCSLCLHKQHQLYPWIKEILTGNITSTPLPYYPQGADNMASCKLLGKLLHFHTQQDFVNFFFVFLFLFFFVYADKWGQSKSLKHWLSACHCHRWQLESTSEFFRTAPLSSSLPHRVA